MIYEFFSKQYCYFFSEVLRNIFSLTLFFIFLWESELCIKKDHLSYFDRGLVVCVLVYVYVCVCVCMTGYILCTEQLIPSEHPIDRRQHFPQS